MLLIGKLEVSWLVERLGYRWEDNIEVNQKNRMGGHELDSSDSG
jgi:hypothetical protein